MIHHAHVPTSRRVLHGILRALYPELSSKRKILAKKTAPIQSSKKACWVRFSMMAYIVAYTTFKLRSHSFIQHITYLHSLLEIISGIIFIHPTYFLENMSKDIYSFEANYRNNSTYRYVLVELTRTLVYLRVN